MLPNFFIIGAPRSGTTTLYETLKQHPQIFLSPVKEPMFFILEGDKTVYRGPKIPQGVREVESYRSLFRNAGMKQAVGEASPCYLFSPQALRGIKNSVPDAKFIVILRNPVDRAYSHFLFHRMEGTEPIADFEAAMAAESERAEKGWFIFWNYRGMGFYGRQIERYFSHFDQRQFRFFLLEDLRDRPRDLFTDIFRFLKVDDGIRVQLHARYNPAGIPKNRFLHAFLTKPNMLKNLLKRLVPNESHSIVLTRSIGYNLAKPTLGREVRGRILDIYREDILKTQALIHRDLSSWLEP
jgi:hypothetical protein